ncbi:Fpg/Nei family DNA glycosylase [Paenibacillus humicola]|uniref:Fpg/Nei family DNA glycosylase n=1 Tax=Paenibacillus humicola TaxID=3110540 RepID=UPI00237A5A46|nr:DNA-formamidopyrimidine glycosylase family protein [Paenibacillus humicola]
MPEWPEMENYREQLAAKIAGQPIIGAEVSREKSINMDKETFIRELAGRTVWFVERRGKMLVFHLDNGKRLVLHLMLGGMIRFGGEEDLPGRSVQVAISFPNGTLSFIGLRLGYLHLLTAKEVAGKFSELGPDPFDVRLTPVRFRERFRGKRGSLKSALVDQHVLAGIGNCYADEIAFDAEVRPDARLQDLEPETWDRLYGSMRKVLREAASYGGYMEMPLSSEDTRTGGYNERCRVYDRGGEPCPRCGAAIEQGEIGGRKFFSCRSCQRDR